LSILGLLEEDRKTYRVMTRCSVAGNDAKDLGWTAEWLFVASVEERGVAGVEAYGDRPHFRVGRNATSFD
jgi:hypothetical protein